MDRSEFIKEVSKIVAEHWREEETPLFIADIPTKIRETKGINYKDVLADERLKKFTVDTEGPDSYKVVMHPNQIAKIGLIPYEVDFSFEDKSNNIKTPSKSHISGNSRETTLSFLELIDNLPIQEKTSIEIPTYIIAKLISKK